LLYTHGFPLTTLFIRTMIGGQKQEGSDIIVQTYGEHGFRVIDKFSLGTNCNKDYEYEGFGVDITTLLKIMDEGEF